MPARREIDGLRYEVDADRKVGRLWLDRPPLNVVSYRGRSQIAAIIEAFGADRCMLGSDLPIETLRSNFDGLYAAYDAIFDSCSEDDRRLLFGDSARRLYGRTPPRAT